MSRRIKNMVIIEAEPDMICFQCGKIAGTRPYGKDGAEICHDCGEKDPFTTHFQMGMKLFGMKEHEASEWAKSMVAEHYPCADSR